MSPHLICEAAPDGSYWIVNHGGIINVKDGKRLKTISTGVREISITSIYPKPVLKINNHLHPVRFWTIVNDTLVPYSIPPHAPEDIKEVLQLHKDYTCYITKDALMIRDKKGKLLYNFDEFNPLEHFPDLASYPKLLDQQDILWITTENGLLKLTAKQNPFEVLLPGDSMRGIFKDKETLWIGGGGYRDTLPDAVKPEQEYLNPRLNDAMSFYKDLQGHLWIGTRGKKILEYIPGQDTYIYYNFSAEKRSFYLPFQNPVTKNYWIGTNNGLVRFNKKRKEVTSFPLPAVSKTLIIRQFHYNAQGIWIAGSKGIFLMDAEKETIIKHYNTVNGLPVNNIFHIHEDNEGIFWLGTKEGGLIRWDIKANTFTQYTTEDGLSHNKIYAVYEDDFETLWLPSDYGLMGFDKNTATTKVYLPQNGIAHEEFNRFSHFQDKDGTLYFGGLNGITKFHPNDLREEAGASLPLYVTRVRVLEKDSETFRDRTQTYTALQKIRLNPGDRILELDLSLLDYEQSGKNKPLWIRNP